MYSVEVYAPWIISISKQPVQSSRVRNLYSSKPKVNTQANGFVGWAAPCCKMMHSPKIRSEYNIPIPIGYSLRSFLLEPTNAQKRKRRWSMEGSLALAARIAKSVR